MDQDDEIRKFKMILVAGVAFLFSAYFSWQELKFALWGESAEARVTRTFETAERRRPQSIGLFFRFSLAFWTTIRP